MRKSFHKGEHEKDDTIERYLDKLEESISKIFRNQHRIMKACQALYSLLKSNLETMLAAKFGDEIDVEEHHLVEELRSLPMKSENSGMLTKKRTLSRK